ncbi:DNA polymerase Y family protein [Alcanivorax sp. JB21]|uniref:Y-family DNA polymerase n=1 Tax=Alcanivorax limicola TaxID=2874102 RepID=UPI001CC15310|nr:DNA polymerase Y family protein [Alcanivorax limicola]MBZ2189954.1 DNA polymerase Y family protein [Alcanivorax limicola]
MARTPLPLWCAIRLPQWPLEIRQPPADNTYPRAIVVQQRIHCCCAQSQALGVMPGMKLATAHALADNLQLTERDPVLEQQYLQQLGWQLMCFTPGVSLYAARPPDDLQGDVGLLLDIGGSLRLFQGSENLLVALHTRLAASGHVWRTGLGHTPLAAWQLSHAPAALSLQTLQAAESTRDISRYRAAFCSALQQQHITTLALAQPLRQALQAPGFRTLGDLLALPRQALGKRFGKALLLWCEQLLGERPDPREPLAAPERFHVSTEFSDAVSHSQHLLPVMQQQLQALSDYLHWRHQATRAIRWQLQDHQGEAESLIVRRATPGADADLWLTLSERRLEQHRLRAPVLKLTLTCARPRAAEAESQTLLHEPGARSNGLALLEKLASLPQLQLSRLRSRDDHLPELAQSEDDPLAHMTDTGSDAEHTRVEAPWSRQPLWLFDPPEPVQQKGQNGLCWRGSRLLPLLPDRRLATQWWQADAVAGGTHAGGTHGRDYYLAHHPASGSLCWLFRLRYGLPNQTAAQKDVQWFVQGIF